MFRVQRQQCSTPTLLPRPEWHVETVRVHPFAKFGHIKQKARRMARERAARRAGA